MIAKIQRSFSVLLMLPAIIETQRLKLRPLRFEDVDDIYTYASDAEFSRYLPIPLPYTAESARQFVAHQVLLDREKHPAWGIELFGRVVGGINLRFHDVHRTAEMGYAIAPRCWGKGYVTEAAQMVIDVAFSEVGTLHKIRAMADLRNIGSWRVMEKIGMIREGVLRQNRVVHDEFIDEVWCGILRPEWEKNQ